MKDEENTDLVERATEFALRIVRMFAALPKKEEARVLGKQVLRSGASIGANYREAQRARCISRKIEAAGWGAGVVDQLASFLARTQPGLKGFSRQNLFRMRQFYEAYRDNEIVSALLRQFHPETLSIFRDSYVIEFLGLPDGHSEADLHRGLLRQLRDFITEMGRDFCFVGSEFPLQVGKRDFALRERKDEG